jgi:hypothetical protein
MSESYLTVPAGRRLMNEPEAALRMPGRSIVRSNQGLPEVKRVGGLIAVHLIVELYEPTLDCYLAVACSCSAMADAGPARSDAWAALWGERQPRISTSSAVDWGLEPKDAARVPASQAPTTRAMASMLLQPTHSPSPIS